MAIIKTSKGIEILVDDDKFEELNKIKWHINHSGYAMKTGEIAMHRILTNCPKGMTVDHLNNNKLDNRLENLEIVTQSENTIRRHTREWNAFFAR